MFGRHIWDFARQADALGHRTFELRHPEQWNLQPVEPFRRLLDEVAAREDTPGRLAALYDALVPGLLRRYREYLDATDGLLDAPSVDLVSRNAADLVRQREDAVRLRAEHGIPAAPVRGPGAARDVDDDDRRARDGGVSVKTIGSFEFGGLSLREEPARDDCFRVVRNDAEMRTFGDTGELARREAVHRHMSNEITSIDIAAQCLAEFPDAPWGLRMELARQCWDESRHVAGLERRLNEMGGHKGEFPISTFEWNVTCAIDNLPGRLALAEPDLRGRGPRRRRRQHPGLARSGRQRDGRRARRHPRRRGPARPLRQPLAEDLHRARPADAVQDRRGRALRRAGQRRVPGRPARTPAPRAAQPAPAVNIADRKLAEFTDDEVQEILRQAGFRSLAARAGRRPARVSDPGLDPALFGPNPARDARFEVRDVRAEMANFSEDDPERTVEFLHRQMNEEVDGLEMSARNLTDFPDAAWGLRLAIARQCSDEARHVDMFRRCFEARGGRVGQYPVLNFQYRIITRIDSLIGRLAVQNRSFEAAGLDAIQQEILVRVALERRDGPGGALRRPARRRGPARSLRQRVDPEAERGTGTPGAARSCARRRRRRPGHSSSRRGERDGLSDSGRDSPGGGLHRRGDRGSQGPHRAVRAGSRSVARRREAIASQSTNSSRPGSPRKTTPKIGTIARCPRKASGTIQRAALG